MKTKKFLTLACILVVMTLLVVGCGREPTYQSQAGSYGQQQPSAIGGGCGVAPVSDVGETPLQIPDAGLAA